MSEEATIEPEAQQPQVDVAALIRDIQAKQNLPMAIVAGVITCLIGAAIWAAVTVATEYQIGYMAIGVGALVGFGVRIAGKGVTNTFGIVGAVCALVGCVLGNFLTMIGFISAEMQLGFFDTLFNFDFSFAIELMKETFQPMDLLFYAIAVYAGFKFSFKQFDEEQLAALSKS